MADTATLIRRKLLPARSANAPGGGSVAALLRKTMPRDADELLGLDLSVGSVALGEAEKTALIAGISPHDLVYPLEAEDGARGTCRVSPPLVAGLIEIQMSGRVSATEKPPRAPTRTDGILCGEIVDHWLETACRVAGEADLTASLPTAGFSRRSKVLDRRNAELWLEPVSFRTLSVDLTLDGSKSGTLVFATPSPMQAALPGGKYAAGMRRHLPDLRAEMRVVLARMPLSVSRARKLAVGDVIDVPLNSLRNVMLEGASGHLIAEGRLGQMGGRRAVRLVPPGGTETAGDALPFDLPMADPEAGTPPGLPKIPAGAKPPNGLPELPDLPEGAGALPDLPDLPDLPELPDLPNLPET